MTSGGIRKGAGRKRRQVPKVAFTVRLEREEHEMLEGLRGISGNSQSAEVSELIKKAAMAMLVENMELRTRRGSSRRRREQGPHRGAP